MKRVLLLRAKEDIPRTAKKLRQLGYDVVKSPVLKITGTDEPIPAGPFDALLITSDKGLEFAGSAEAYKAQPMHIVGSKTARHAAEQGWRVDLVAETAEQLASQLLGRHAAPGRFLYLAGRNRKPLLEKKLIAAGHTVATAEVYEARPEQKLWKEARTIIAQGGVKYALHYSRRSASIFVNLARSAKLLKEIREMNHLALSNDVAGPLRAAGLNVSMAPEPNEDNLLSLLPKAA